MSIQRGVRLPYPIQPICRGAAIWVLVLLFIGFFAPVVRGSVFHVTDINDTTNVTSLRGAIMAANNVPWWKSENVIILSLGTYHLTIPKANGSPGSSGELEITQGNLTIETEGTNVAIIDATGLGDRVLSVDASARVWLRNLVVTGGKSRDGQDVSYGRNTFFPGNAKNGGGICNAGWLVLDHCTISNNACGTGEAGFYTEVTIFPFDYLRLSTGAKGGNGGGVFNTGTLTLSRCFVCNNSAGNGGSGGAFNGISHGGAGGNGGGICNLGDIMLVNCIINANTGGAGGVGGVWAQDLGGTGGNGGGIYNSGKLLVIRCTISDNIAGDGGGDYAQLGNGGHGGDGGGLFNANRAMLDTCTLGGNQGGNGGTGAGGDFPSEISGIGFGGRGGWGGGICNTGVITITSCTLSGNSGGTGGTGGAGAGGLTSGGDGGSGGSGGGIFNERTIPLVILRNAIVASNSSGSGGPGGSVLPLGSPQGTNGISGADGTGPDLSGNFTTGGFNLIGAADGSAGFTNGIHADQIGSVTSPIDPLLGPLQMNGGPTPTQALLPGSPAINQGKSFGEHTDQRGHHRPFLYPSIANAPGGDGTDIGSFELDTPLP